MAEPDIPPRIQALLTRTQTRRRDRTQTRAVLAERRDRGLTARHKAKLAR